MDEEYELVDSPLSTEITRSGMTVHVHIYRGADEDGWILEVEDSIGGSTVWKDRFATDQDALAEAMMTIERDGIGSFLKDPSPRPH